MPIIKFIKDTYTALFKPWKYYSGIAGERGIVEPVIRTFIYATIAGLISAYKSYMLLIFNSQYFTVDKPFLIVLVSFSGVMLAGFIMLVGGSIALSVISVICKGNWNLRLNLRASASIIILLPIYAFLLIFNWNSILLVLLTNILILSYGSWMTYNAVIKANNANKLRAAIIIVLIYLPLLLYTALRPYDNNKTINPLKMNLDDKEFQKKFDEQLKKQLQEQYE